MQIWSWDAHARVLKKLTPVNFHTNVFHLVLFSVIIKIASEWCLKCFKHCAILAILLNLHYGVEILNCWRWHRRSHCTVWYVIYILQTLFLWLKFFTSSIKWLRWLERQRYFDIMMTLALLLAHHFTHSWVMLFKS